MVDELTKKVMVDPTARPPELNDAMAKVIEKQAFIDEIAAAVERGNKELAHVEKVKKIWVLNRDFSIEENEMTPTMKMKRRVLEKKFADVLDRLYAESDFGVSIRLD